MKRYCQQCEIEISGRTDKKFCSDYCRTTYHNQENRSTSFFVRQINYVLKKNRRILEKLNPEGRAKVHKQQLQKAGFDFNYVTSFYRTQKGYTYYFCYEQGYLPLGNGFMALVINREFQQLIETADLKSI